MCAFLGAELLAANALWAGSSAVSVGAGLGALGLGVSAISAISQGQAQSDAAKYNAQVAENNAIAARQKASFDAELRREQLARVQAQARANIGKTGGDFSGSALDIMAENAAAAELDALAIRYGGEVRATGLEAQAVADRSQASTARAGGYFGAGAKILSGAMMFAPGTNQDEAARLIRAGGTP